MTVFEFKPVVLTVKLTFAFDALLDLGTYPILRARETTFSRRVALSIKDSFTAILVLKAVI